MIFIRKFKLNKISTYTDINLYGVKMKFCKIAFLSLGLLSSIAGFSNEVQPSLVIETNHASVAIHESKSSHETHKREVGPIDSATALRYLKNGNIRFTHNKLRKDGIAASDLKRLSTGQKPHTIVLSCSDSRVPPEVLFDQKLGEIFVIRTAGQALDSSVIASIEYAVSHLGTNLIVVMGHESCGAVKAALSTLSGGDAGSPSLNKLVADIHPRLARFSRLPASEGVKIESWSNVEGVATDLAARSEIIQKAIESGELKIEKALYHLDSGSVEWK